MIAQNLKKSILQEAISGRLVSQIESEGTADDLLQQIAKEHREAFLAQQAKEKAEAEANGKKFTPKKYVPLTFSVISEDEQPFEIPNSWRWVRLGDIFEMKAGKNISASELSQEMDAKHQYLCYGGNGVRGYIGKSNCSGQHCIIGRQGALCGNLKLADGSFYATEHAVVVYHSKMINVKWAYYFLMISNLNQYATATAQPGLSVSTILKTLIPLPPLSEQRRIVSKLESLLPKIDSLSETETRLSVLESTLGDRLWKSVLQEAIAGRLTTQLESDGTADILLDQIKAAHREAFDAEQAKDKASAEKSGKKFVPKKYTPLTFSQIPQSEIPFNIPDNWKWVRLGEIAETMLGKTLDREKNTGEYCNYLCAVNIKWMKIDFSVLKQIRLEPTDKEKYRLKKGDLLVCEGGDVARSAIWEDDSREMYYQNALHRLRFYGGINQYYILYVIYVNKLSGYIDRISKGVTIKHFTQDLLKNLLIPLPPLSEQERIVAKLDRLRGALGRD